jgi:hypothetical protein
VRLAARSGSARWPLALAILVSLGIIALGGAYRWLWLLALGVLLALVAIALRVLPRNQPAGNVHHVGPWFIGQESWTVLQLFSTRARRPLFQPDCPKGPAGTYHAVHPASPASTLCGKSTRRLHRWNAGFHPTGQRYPDVCARCAAIALDRWPADVDPIATERYLTRKGAFIHDFLHRISTGRFPVGAAHIAACVPYSLVSKDDPPALTEAGKRLLASLGPYPPSR